MPFTSKVQIVNRRSAPQVIVVEPWAPDYTLLPGEKLQIVALSETTPQWFEIEVCEGTTRVSCEDSDDFKVLQSERELECGHQRQVQSGSAADQRPTSER